MNEKEYIEVVRKTAVYPNQGKNLPYAILGLVEETGELKEKMDVGDRDGAILELGDVFWYIAAAAIEAGLDAEAVLASECEGVSFGSRGAVSLAIMETATKASGVAKKVLRDDGGVPSPERAEKLRRHLSLLATLCDLLGCALRSPREDTWGTNAKKLLSRKERGTIRGDGDHR